MKLILDLETDGLRFPWDSKDGRVATKILCGCVINVDTNDIVYYDNTQIEDLVWDIDNAGEALELIGHNIQSFDIPILEKFHNLKYRGKIFDTKIAARVIYPDLKTDDWTSKIAGKPWRQVPNKLMGSHSLEAWGIRLGERKDTTQDRKNFTEYTKEMLEYCMQDCRVTLALYKNLISQNPSEESLQLEHKFAKIIDQQIINGFTLDLKKTQELTQELQKKRCELEENLTNLFPPREIQWETPIRKEPRTKVIIFNPGSRDQVVWNLINKYGWKPERFTDSGKPQMDEEVLSELPYPEAKALVEFFLLQKRIGQIAEGDNAWLKLVHKDGKIHGGVNTNGTVTGRCSFIAPNMGQVPRVGNPFGKECRGLFTASPGWFLVGCDAAGIQLRLLAHYLAKYDKGNYAEQVINGDIHEHNRQAAGLDTRDQAKTFIYALLFGAGPRKIARIIGRDAGAGKQLLNTFLRSIPAFRRLRDDIGKVVETRKTLTGFDGRRYPVRQSHVGLNVLLMGGEAVIMKTATILTHEKLLERGLVHGRDYKQVVHVYDENQFECPTEEMARVIGEAAALAIREAGEKYNLKCPLKGEYKVGRNWADTH